MVRMSESDSCAENEIFFYKVAVLIRIRQTVIHACQKPTRFTLISYSETVANYITKLSLSFGWCLNTA